MLAKATPDVRGGKKSGPTWAIQKHSLILRNLALTIQSTTIQASHTWNLERIHRLFYRAGS